MKNDLFWLVPFGSLLALGFAYYFFKEMMKASEGTDTMKKIALHVRTGAMAYLRQQYRVVTIVFIILTAIFAILAYVFKIQNPWVPFAFITGGFFSGLSGFFGMKTATYASARAAHAAEHSLNAGLRVAFRSGAVMGLVVVGLGLLDISIWFYALNYIIGALDNTTNQMIAADPSMKLIIITTTTLTFGMGASTQALFARVGGGIFTKAADVGADLLLRNGDRRHQQPCGHHSEAARRHDGCQNELRLAHRSPHWGDELLPATRKSHRDYSPRQPD